jgi:signal transduction histidine kinase
LTGGHSTAVVRIIDDLVELVAFTSVSPEADAALQASFPRPVTAYPLFELVRGGQVVEIPDSESELGARTGARDIGRARGFRSLLLTPLRNEQGLIGLISVTRKEPGTFADHHVQLLRTFADQAVIAIENVRLFDQVKLRTDELSRSLNDLQTAQNRLIQTEKLASLGQLTAGIAHEIKNPLNFVNNFASVSAELVGELRELLDGAGIDDGMQASVDELSELLQSNLEKVVQHGKRADSIVKNMLLHSRDRSGDHMRVNINTMVSESLQLAYHGARAEKAGFNITLEQNLDPSAGELEVYPQEISRVLLNLISNGFHAAMARKAELNGAAFEPTISASTQNLGDWVEIRIRDNGTGIPPGVKKRMFDPFFTTKPAGEGTGLGLSLSHDVVVKQHAGAIEVETQPGAFTEFRIVLPRTAASIGAGALA